MSKNGVAVGNIGYTKHCKDCPKAKGTNCQWRKDNPGRTGCPEVYMTLGNVITRVLGDSRLRQKLGTDIVREAEEQCEQWKVMMHSRSARPRCDACDDTGEVWAEIWRVNQPYVTVFIAPRPCPRCAMGMFARELYLGKGMPVDAPRFGYGPVDDPHFFTYDSRGDVGGRYELLPEPPDGPPQDPGPEGWRREMKRIDGKMAAAGGI